MKQLFLRYFKSTVTFILSLFMMLLAATKANAQWAELGGKNNSPFTGIILSIATDNHKNVYAGGISPDVNNYPYVGKWNGSTWTELGAANGSHLSSGLVWSIATDAAGNVYAGGSFYDANGNPYVAKWDGTTWSELGGLSGSPFTNKYHSNVIYSIATDVAGNVYAAGGVQDANGNFYVAKWDGTAWSKLGGANDSTISKSVVNSIAIDASGNVYAGGVHDAYYNDYVVKWNGVAWSELGGSNGSAPFNKHTIQTIATDGGGNVYAGGMFTNANGYPYVAKWDGTAWSELGGASDSILSHSYGGGKTIYSVTTDLGGNVYAGGLFNNTNGRFFVAKWNGVTWSEVGGTNSSPFLGFINTVAVDATEDVYAGGNFYDSNINTYVAKYIQNLIVSAQPNTLIANYEYTDSTTGWTNYYSNGTLLLSLNKHGQNIGTIGDGTFAVKLSATAGAGTNTAIQLTNPLITNPSGYWVMNRYWQVTATVEPTASVGVRFYYNNQDLADVNGSYPSHNLTNQQLIFYKETGGNPDPTTNLAGATSLVSILLSASASDNTWTYHQLTDSTQYAEFSVSDFSGGGGGGTGNNQALPINLLSFAATKQGTDNLLQWTTGQEINSRYFEVERSGDGANFTTIAQVGAAGNSSIAKRYSLVDTKPVIGTNYYRLKMVNADGGFAYSPIRTVNEAIRFTAGVYPNPVRDQLNLNFYSDKEKTLQVQIVSNAGRVLITKQIRVATGASTQTINTTSLSNGVYYVKLVGEKGQTELKFVEER